MVHTSPGDSGEFFSSVFLWPNKDRGYRMILNLKQFNKFTDKIHFEMETLQHTLSLVTKNCYMTIFDLRDTYLVVSIVEVDVKFLKFTFQGKLYMYRVLPLGLSSAPRKFTKLLKPILSMLRRQVIIITIYIDDGWV